jgi:hypothetical protein
MEVDSLEQNNSLRDYWKKKEKKKEKQGWKDGKRKGANGRDSVEREADTDPEGQGAERRETLDPTCLIPITSPVEETNQKERVHTSEQITTTEEKSDLGTPDYLRDFNALYGPSPEDPASISPVDVGRGVGMETNTSPNQDDNGQQDASIDQLHLSDDITILLEGSEAEEKINT